MLYRVLTDEGFIRYEGTSHADALDIALNMEDLGETYMESRIEDIVPYDGGNYGLMRWVGRERIR